MVVLSTVICNKRGKILLARQYRPMSKLQIEEAVSNFPKMISSEQQHTFIEDDKMRYVYLPMEALYLVILTSKNSNIIEDIEIARLLYKLVLRVTQSYGINLLIIGVNEKGVVKSAFELILAFDDVITIGGYRESVTLSHIGSYLEMDSQDQKAHIQARKEQEDEAKATTNEKLKAIIQREKEDEMRRLAQGGAGLGVSGDTSGGSKFMRSDQDETRMFQTSADDFIPKPQEPVRTGGLSLGRGGIKLKKKQQEQDEYFEPMFKFAAQEAEEEKFIEAKQEPDTLLKMNIDISVEEKLSFVVAKDGEIEKLELKGTLYLTVNNPKFAASLIQLQKAKHPKSLKIKASPDMDRGRWEESKSLAPEEGQKFPVGQKIPALTYRYSSTDESAMPFLLSVWESGNKQQLTLELEPNDSPLLAYQPFSKVDFTLPLRQGRPQVLSAKNAEFATGQDTLILRAKDWSSKGALMKLKCHNSAALFPIEISSEENWSVLGWRVNTARSAEGEEPSLSFKSQISIDNSHITN